MRNKFILTLLLSIPLFSLAQIKNPDYKIMLDSMYQRTVPLISVDSLNHIKGAYILDTRETKEYDVSHIKNARCGSCKSL